MQKEKHYIIGIDGGGTKTVAAIADLKGKILKTAKTGSSSPVNVGVKIATVNIAKAIKKVLRKGEILSTFIGLAAIQEEPRFKKEIKKELLKYKEISSIFKGKLEIGSDQIVAYRAGSDKKDGVLIIAGTGCVAHGWNKGKELTAGGWHWLADEGSAFWTGQKAFQAVMKDLDKRGSKTLITDLAFKKLKAKNTQEFLKKVYSENFIKNISFFSIFTDNANKKGDEIAKEILKEAGKELALSAKTVIKVLGMQKRRFPLVLVGGMFKSEIILNTVKKEIKKVAPKVKFVHLKKEPVIGAVKLAKEILNENH